MDGISSQFRSGIFWLYISCQVVGLILESGDDKFYGYWITKNQMKGQLMSENKFMQLIATELVLFCSLLALVDSSNYSLFYTV